MPYGYCVACGCMLLARNKSPDKVCSKTKRKHISSFPKVITDLSLQFVPAHVGHFCCRNIAVSTTICVDKKKLVMHCSLYFHMAQSAAVATKQYIYSKMLSRNSRNRANLFPKGSQYKLSYLFFHFQLVVVWNCNQPELENLADNPEKFIY